MAEEALIVFLTCGLIFLIIVISSWCRRRKLAQKEQDSPSILRIEESFANGQRAFRIATVSRQSDRLELEVYEVRLPRRTDGHRTATIARIPPTTTRHTDNLVLGQPPPPFSTAINMPSPVVNSVVCEESNVPPPRYDEVIPISVISGNKIPEATNQKAVTVS